MCIRDRVSPIRIRSGDGLLQQKHRHVSRASVTVEHDLVSDSFLRSPTQSGFHSIFVKPMRTGSPRCCCGIAPQGRWSCCSNMKRSVTAVAVATGEGGDET
eukprot:2032132-Pyramimonas_sp.AAC.1